MEKLRGTPGPGSYEVSLPLVQPAYEAIRKNEAVVILKVNYQCEDSNFNSAVERFKG